MGKTSLGSPQEARNVTQLSILYGPWVIPGKKGTVLFLGGIRAMGPWISLIKKRTVPFSL